MVALCTWSVLARVVTIFLVVSLAFDIFHQKAPNFKDYNVVVSLVGLVVAGMLSSPNLEIPRARTRCRSTTIASVLSSRKLIMVVYFVNKSHASLQ